MYLDTFRTGLKKRNIKSIASVADLIDLYLVYNQYKSEIPTYPLVIGGGSNVLFVEQYIGPVILNDIKGVILCERADAWHLHVGSGESWHDFVTYTIREGMYGLENLALIPGTVGAAPIQNIGAYGVELKEFCEYVEVLDTEALILTRYTREECQFGYRDSIFKRAASKKLIITGVGFCLPKNWRPVLTYGELSKLEPRKVTAEQIYDLVIKTRKEKLPDPSVVGNAGSFFKNPIVPKAVLVSLLEKHPNLPHYPINEANQEGFVKLAAGWLIDQCGLKGTEFQGAQVHENQALVLINAGNATGKDVAYLAKKIQNSVKERFNIKLEPEVRFIGRNGEVNALKYLDKLK